MARLAAWRGKSPSYLCLRCLPLNLRNEGIRSTKPRSISRTRYILLNSAFARLQPGFLMPKIPEELILTLWDKNELASS